MTQSKVPSAEDFADWLESKGAGEKIGPLDSFFNDSQCTGCAIGQYAAERFGVTTSRSFWEVFKVPGKTWVESIFEVKGSWSYTISRAHLQEGAKTRESLLNVIAPFLEKEKLPELVEEVVEIEVVAESISEESLTTYKECLRSFQIEKVETVEGG